MEEWKEYKLGNILQISSGFAYKGKDIGYGNNCLLGMGCVSFKEKFLKSGIRNYNGDCPEKYCVKPNDMVLATRQQSDNLPILGMPAIIPDDLKGDKIIVGANLYKVENKSDFDSQYIYWLLKSPSYVDYIRSCQTGTTVRMITKANIESYSFLAPNKKCRDRIVSILSSLDDKIEVNRRINEQLEELAQALFKSWFVDFEPFKDGEFVESELGMIPEGWKVETLGELCDSISKKHSFKKDKLIFLNTGDIHNNIYLHNNYTLVKDMPGQAKKTIEKGDILYSEIRPVNRHFALVNFDSTDYVVSTKLMVIRSRNINNLRLFQYLTSKDVVDFLQQEAETRSGTFPQIRFENIQRLKMIIASNDVETKYASLLSSIYSRMENNNKEITHLTNLRDTLLPKLMSGEIDVNEVEI